MSRVAAVLCVVVAALALPTAARGEAGPVSSHAQIHTCCTPAGQVERIFAESKAMGAAYVRVDFELNAIFEAYGAPVPVPDWTRVDHVLALSRRYDLPVLGIVLGTPTWISACAERWPHAGKCAATDPAEYGRMAGELAAHARGAVRHWEILNEPDGSWAFEGTPEQYARMLSASHDAIKARAPEARVLLGGLMTPWQTGWLDRVFATPGAAASRKFDIAAVHLRGPTGGLAHNLNRWRTVLAQRGFTGPVWVTEHGYAADPAYQTDPAYTGAEAAQAAYLRRSLLRLAEAGSAQVFVTLRDWGAPEWASEGVTSIADEGDYPVRRKPAFAVVRRFAEQWPAIVRWRRAQQQHERMSEFAGVLAGAGDLRVQSLTRGRDRSRAALRAERRRLRRVRAAARGARGTALRRLRSRVRSRERRVRWRRARLARVQHELSSAIAETAAHRGDQVANAVAAADYRRRVEG